MKTTTPTTTTAGTLPATSLQPSAIAANALRSATSDMLLIERCKADDAGAWNTLIARYQKTVYRIAYSFCHNAEDASDVAAHVYLQIYLKLSSFRSESSFASWLYRIIRNTYLDMFVRPLRFTVVSLDTAGAGDAEQSWACTIPDTAPLPETASIRKETSRMLGEAISHLPAYQRQVLQMYHMDGVSYNEISERTGIRIGTVKSRLNRARTMLRERLLPVQEMFV